MKKDHKVEELCDLFAFYVSKRENFIAFSRKILKNIKTLRYNYDQDRKLTEFMLNKPPC